MKCKGLMALAVAGALGLSGTAFAGPGKHASAHEVMTPSSVNESAPWLAGQPHLGGGQSDSTQIVRTDESIDGITTASVSDHEVEAVGASSSEGGSGSGGFSSGEVSSSDEDSSGPAM